MDSGAFLKIAAAAATVVLLSAPAAQAGRDIFRDVFPVPKAFAHLGGEDLQLPADRTLIVIGASATEPEEYAAESLQKLVRLRYGHEWRIVRDEKPSAGGAAVIIGQASTCRLAAAVAREWTIDPARVPASHDGYQIRTGRFQGRPVALVLGSNPRSCIYGQDTLSQLLQNGKSGLALPRVAVRDWSSIKWRGRPHAVLPGYDRPGTFDLFARARVNYIDLRDGPGIYGTPPGHPLDKERMRRVLREAHRRGMVVYGVVDCAVPEPRREAVLKTFEEFIELGVDGLWISIDDPGGDERIGTPLDLVRRIVELGKRHGITGEMIAMTPGKESYKNIDTQTNRNVMQIPGMNEALLFFTVLPSKESLEAARRVGLKSLPCWWHNWPRPRGGFLHQGSAPGRADGGKPYIELMALYEGWHTPRWEELRNAGQYVAAVQPWGGSAWPDDWVAGVIDLWAWAPELHDWDKHRRRIYSLVFGPGQVEAARRFDDALASLKSLFVVSPELPGDCKNQPDPAWPPRLSDPADAGKALKLISEMEELLPGLQEGARRESLFDHYAGAGALEEYFLEPQRKTVEVARTITGLTFPEYWWETHRQRVMLAATLGQGERAAIWAEEGRQRALKEARAVRDALPVLQNMGGYVQEWRERFKEPATARFADRKPDMKGDLSDPLWKSAQPVTGFGLSTDAGEAEDQTEVRMLYTAEAFYVGVLCHESAVDRMGVTRTEEGSDVWEDDSVELFINTDCLGRPYWQFVANAGGVRSFSYQRPATAEDRAPNPEWQVRTARGTDRWTAEIRVPYSTLGISGSPRGQIWMVNVVRNDFASPQTDVVGEHWMQTSAWGFRPRGSNHDPRKFNPVVFE
ncbi:MAG: glycoside hydrolase family 20 zincin-like fold domain-containing protein [Armatimonadota bacterium]